MLAKNDGSSYVEPRHILSALATDDRNGLASILKRHGYRTSAICSQPTVMQHFPHALPSFSQSATVMIELASDLAIRRGEIITAPAHIALALLRSKDEEVERTLLEQGVDVAVTMRDILHDLGGSDIIVEIFGEQYDALKWSQEAQRIIAALITPRVTFSLLPTFGLMSPTMPFAMAFRPAKPLFDGLADARTVKATGLLNRPKAGRTPCFQFGSCDNRRR